MSENKEKLVEAYCGCAKHGQWGVRLVNGGLKIPELAYTSHDYAEDLCKALAEAINAGHQERLVQDEIEKLTEEKTKLEGLKAASPAA